MVRGGMERTADDLVYIAVRGYPSGEVGRGYGASVIGGKQERKSARRGCVVRRNDDVEFDVMEF